MILHITSPVIADAMSSEDVTKLERAFNTKTCSCESLSRQGVVVEVLLSLTFPKIRFYFYYASAPQKCTAKLVSELTTL